MDQTNDNKTYIIKKVLTVNPNNNEGETCIHNNSWHSECMLCNSESLIDDIFSLVREYSNNSELGAKVRELYYVHTNSDATIIENPTDKDRKRWGG